MRALFYATILLGGVLAACAPQQQPAPPQETRPAQLVVLEMDRKTPEERDGGIGGTGVRTTGVLGAITGFGSIHVNGLRLVHEDGIRVGLCHQRGVHLIGLELNISVLSAALRGEPTGQPADVRQALAAPAGYPGTRHPRSIRATRTLSRFFLDKFTRLICN